MFFFWSDKAQFTLLDLREQVGKRTIVMVYCLGGEGFDSERVRDDFDLPTSFTVLPRSGYIRRRRLDFWLHLHCHTVNFTR
jgi:hypothetical protein